MSSDFTMNRRGFLKGAAALAALSALAPAGALADGDASKPIVIGRAQDSDNLDPVTCVGNTNIFIFNLILEGLVMTSDDGSDIELCLAESYDVSDDGLTYTFKVKEGLTFSDGSPVTAEDWQFTFDRAIQSEDSNWHMCVENLDHVECPDDTTVIVYMKSEAASTLANLCIFTLGVQSKAYFESVGADRYVDGPLGTGAYMIKEWKRGEYMAMTANPYYREDGVPATADIEFRVVADDASRQIQLQGGDIDIAVDLPLSSLMQIESDPNCVVAALPSTITRFMSLNVENEYLAHDEARQALIKATDPQEIVDVALFGYGTAIGTIFAPTSKYCDHSLDPVEPDIEGAKALLAQAGLDGGFPITILMRSGNEVDKQIAMILTQQWAKIGVTVSIEEIEATSYKTRMYAMDFDAIIDYWSDDIQDPSEFMQWIFDFDGASGFDTNFRQPDDMVALNDACNAETDDDKRVEMYHQMQQTFREQAVWIPLFTMPWPNATRADIVGFHQTPLGNFRFNELARA